MVEVKNPDPIQLVGVGIVRLSKIKTGTNINLIYQKGIGIQLIQKIIHLKEELILKKRNGILIDLICNYTTYTHFFDNNQEDINVIIYIDERVKILNFSKLYLISEKLNKYLISNSPLKKIIEICDDEIYTLRSEGIIAFFIISKGGQLFFSNINKEKTAFKNYEIQISGFISALIAFSTELITQKQGVTLKEINFGNRHFYVTFKDDVIFAYLIEEFLKSTINKRHIYLITEEFLNRYRDYITNFNGNISIFADFQEVINKYFII